MSTRIWIKNPLAIFTGTEQDAGGGLVVAGSVVTELVPAGGKPSAPVNETLDASQHVVIPGLINTHHHFYQTLTRAFPSALNKKLFPWLQTLYPIWAGLRPEHVAVSTELALAELMLSGCTTAADHHYVFPEAVPDGIDIQANVAKKMGMRVALTRGSMSLGQDQGGLPPQSVVQDEDTIMAESERLVNRLHDPSEGSMTTIALAPCSPFSVTAELMRASAELARKQQVRLHTHLAETNDENDFCNQFAGQRPLDYMESLGWLGPDVWFAHGIHFTPGEMRRMGTAGVGVAHCPSSNMILASGICPTNELEQAGVHVGLAVDGSASNDCSNMMQEVRMSLLIARLRYDADEVTHFDVLRRATQGSAACLGRTDLGTLAPGKQADMALFKLDEPRFSGAGDPLAALVVCGHHRADRVMIAGQWKVKDGQLAHADMADIMHRHTQAAHELTAQWR
ncbi:8-oxoguanine deaminase [Pseudodesulfovibrio senegalensis]|uniref:8-oxoguanine deaminase n=1 Tax=Pseudodesulfovibrio senegalensis TaxID=1721087 RepID=A0A6N6N481_9BACT|nr:8-oxoguanine deaminase [Pseudodesulfovibrio senegalensis]KAB1441494.1 8-oxoguanine deaminase [Pseudodesulfovibrio senegalensis]